MKTNRAYEYDIDALIPIAEKEAIKKVNELGKNKERRAGIFDKVSGKYQYYNYCFFTEYFHAAMKRLTAEAGLRRF